MKTFYLLLIFSIFLKNCQCGTFCNYEPEDCGNNKFKFDINGHNGQFCVCKLDDEDNCVDGNCDFISCENVWKYLINKGYEPNQYACDYLHTYQYNCVFKNDNDGCEAQYCESLNQGCSQLSYCVQDGNSCKVNDCEGFYTEKDCTYITSNGNKIKCKWERNSCKEREHCTNRKANPNMCSEYNTSGNDYKCFKAGNKCVEANSCETIKIPTNTPENEISSIFSNFPHCTPGNNNDCINSCNTITNKDECNYALKDSETYIKCKWNENAAEKKCQVDGNIEIKSCSNATNLNDITNEICSKLKVTQENNNYCRKGPNGCLEFKDCDDINVKVDPQICMELTKPDNDLQCIQNGENGCNSKKLKCLDNSLYIYDKVTCENLDVSMEGYKCLNNGKECIEVNSCDSIKNTGYNTNSENLKKLCDLFDNCEPYKKGCRTIPRTLVKTQKRNKILKRMLNVKQMGIWRNIGWKTEESFKAFLSSIKNLNH